MDGHQPLEQRPRVRDFPKDHHQHALSAGIETLLGRFRL